MSSIDDNVKISLSETQKVELFSNLDKEGKLPCIKAFKVAKKINCRLEDISSITKSLGIKITNCELGVFGKLDFKDKNVDLYEKLINKYGKTILCKDLWNEAKKYTLKDIGSTVKNSDIEVNYCQLGCFREKKGLKNES